MRKTNVNFEIRYKQHTLEIKKKNSTSHFDKPILHNNHSNNTDNVKLN